MPVKIKIRKDWATRTHKGLQAGLLDLASTIDARGKMLAPVDSRNLVTSAKINKETLRDSYTISYGSSKVPYARIQHEGGTIRPKYKPVLAWKDKSGQWHYAKSVTIKGTKWLERAAESVARGDTTKYFKHQNGIAN